MQYAIINDSFKFRTVLNIHIVQFHWKLFFFINCTANDPFFSKCRATTLLILTRHNLLFHLQQVKNILPSSTTYITILKLLKNFITRDLTNNIENRFPVCSLLRTLHFTYYTHKRRTHTHTTSINSPVIFLCTKDQINRTAQQSGTISLQQSTGSSNSVNIVRLERCREAYLRGPGVRLNDDGQNRWVSNTQARARSSSPAYIPILWHRLCTEISRWRYILA